MSIWSPCLLVTMSTCHHFYLSPYLLSCHVYLSPCLHSHHVCLVTMESAWHRFLGDIRSRIFSAKGLWLEAFFTPQAGRVTPKCSQPVNREKPTLKKIRVNIGHGLAVLHINRMWVPRQLSAPERDTPHTPWPAHPSVSALDTQVGLAGGWCGAIPGRLTLVVLWFHIPMSLKTCRKQNSTSKLKQQSHHFPLTGFIKCEVWQCWTLSKI